MPPRYPGLGLEGNTYVVRKVVPAGLRLVVGKRELIRSLKTGDISEARRAWEPVWREFNRTIADAKRGAVPKPFADARASARALPAGQERSRRLQAADRNDADARRVYGDALSRANDRAREAMAKGR